MMKLKINSYTVVMDNDERIVSINVPISASEGSNSVSGYVSLEGEGIDKLTFTEIKEQALAKYRTLVTEAE